MLSTARFFRARREFDVQQENTLRQKKGERKREKGGECHARKASAASDFYSRGHAVASLKIKTFTGKSSGSTQRGERKRESSFMSARPCSRFAENKRRQTPFRVAAAFISPSPPPPPICINPRLRSPVRPSVRRKGRNLYHVLLSGLRYEKEYRALSPGTIFNRLSIVVE